MKTARFRDLVARCGRPVVHLSWSGPTKDPVLQAAAAANRLLTVNQEGRAGRKDHGEVGLRPARSVQYLIFPKSLRAFIGRRIVGIDYGIMGEQVSASAPPVQKRSPKSPAARPAKQQKDHGKLVAFEPVEEPGRKKSPKAERARKSRGEPHDWIREVAEAVKEIRAGTVSMGLARLEELLAAQGHQA
jgi:hypothetical protein